MWGVYTVDMDEDGVVDDPALGPTPPPSLVGEVTEEIRQESADRERGDADGTLLPQESPQSGLPTPPPPVEDIKRRFFEEASQSVAAIANIRDTAMLHPGVRLSAAKILLDYGGFTPTRRIEVISFHVTPKRRQIIDVTVKELQKP